jgi:hypothetical protein
MADTDLQFHALSWDDPIGRLFWKEGKLYRGIRALRSDFYRGLFECGLIQDLIDKKLLVGTRIADYSTSEFPLVLEHDIIPRISFASEWAEASLKAASLVVLDIELVLRKHQATLVDTNPWNMLIERGKPIYVDFCSITPLPNPSHWDAAEQFEQYFLNPLILYSNGLARVARRLLNDPWVGISTETLSKIGMPARIRSSLQKKIVHKLKHFAKTKLPASLLPIAKKYGKKLSSPPSAVRGNRNAAPQIAALRSRIEDIRLSGAATRWAGYYTNNFPSLEDATNWTTKHHAIADIIRNYRPKTLLDIGANRGWYSQLAAHEGVSVIATDSDETSINELCADIEQKKLDVLPLYMDARFPEPAQGPAYKLLPSAGERLKSEMVLALAIIHHLVFTWHLNFEQVIENFAMFTEKWLVIEYVGTGDAVFNRLWDASTRPWYTPENFIAALEKHFVIVSQTVSDSGGLDYSGDDRTLIVCRKKN